MPRLLSRSLLLISLLVLGACTDSLTPSGTNAGPGLRASYIGAPDTGAVRSALNALYPAGAGFTTAANAQLTNVFKSMNGGSVNAAQQQAVALCKFTEKQASAGKLTAGNPSDALTAFCNDVYATAQLAPGGIDVSGEDALAIVVPACTGVTAIVNTGLAGVQWSGHQNPDGSGPCTFDQEETLVISPIDYHKFPAGSGPLAYKGTQWGFFYEITVYPYTIPQNPVTVSLCQVEDGTNYTPPENIHGNLRVAHNVPAETGGVVAQVLPYAPPFINCLPPTIGQADFISDLRARGPLFASRSAATRAGNALLSLVTPTPLYAAHIAAAGLAGSFSPFGAVDFGAPPVTTSWSLSPTTIALDGGKVQMTPVDLSDGTVPLGNCLNGTWRSSSPGVATVDISGTVTPMSLGTSDVSVVCGSGTSGGPFTIRQTVTVVSRGAPTISNVALQSTTLVIGGSNVPYSITIQNPGAALSGVLIQNYIVQGTANKAANGTVVSCPSSTLGDLPQGTCTFGWNAGASNQTGTGTLVPGAATLQVQLMQTVGSTTTVLDTYSVPITLQ